MPFLTSCFENQYDIAFTITITKALDAPTDYLYARYFATGATDKAREFERDLQVWIEDVLRPIGPSLEIEGPKAQPPSRRPEHKRQIVSYEFHYLIMDAWGKYLKPTLK